MQACNMKNEIVYDIDKYIFGGNAEFTILQENPRTNEIISVKYRVQRCKDSPNLYFVSTEKVGSKELMFHGSIRVSQNNSMTYYKGKKVNNLLYSERNIQGLVWLLASIKQGLPPYVHVLHNGRCSRCGRKLKDRESVIRGIGPECRKKVGV